MAINLANPVNWQHPLNRGLVSRWYAIGSPYATGQYWRDLAKRYNGLFTNSPTYSVVRQSGCSPTVSCVAGSSSWVDCGNITQLNGVTYATISAWIYRAGASETAGFGRASSPSGTGTDRFSAIWFSDGNVYVSVDAGAVTYAWVALAGTGWHHIAISYNGSLSADWSRVRMHVDGVYTSWSGTSGTPPATLPSTSGSYAYGRDSTDRQTSGSYDCGAVWTRALSSDEVYSEYIESRKGYPSILNRDKRPLIYQPAAASGGPWPFFMDEMSGGMQTLGMLA